MLFFSDPIAVRDGETVSEGSSSDQTSSTSTTTTTTEVQVTDDENDQV